MLSIGINNKGDIILAILEGYLDIETTGLDPSSNKITVIGIFITGREEDELIQLVGDEISDVSIMEAVKDIETLYTYNGSRFDLPFINARYGVNLEQCMKHYDLMLNCWNKKLYGGLKKVEQCLGIEREVKGVNGLEAINLWYRYINDYDQIALDTLLAYNREDVKNLQILKDKLKKLA